MPVPTMPRPRLLASLPLLSLFILAGCTTTLPKVDGAKYGPFFQPKNFQAIERMPADVRRVAVLPIADDGSHQEEALAPLDTSVIKALSLAARFESVQISREECGRITHSRSIRSVDVLPHDFLERIASTTGADAILFIDLTHYSPYAPLNLGIRAKLVRISDCSVIWAIDQTFSAANPSVANSARRHWLKAEPPDTPVDMSTTALQSPSRFADYVLSASFGTLPPRQKP
ncbi:MAG: hypothetical protein WC378_03800 [Opitutaceae bacterium]|jgi:hypothetical protein